MCDEITRLQITNLAESYYFEDDVTAVVQMIAKRIALKGKKNLKLITKIVKNVKNEENYLTNY